MENKKINIAELLKDSPKGTKLYSPLCGECRVIKVYNYLGFDVINGNDDVFNFSYDGRYNPMGECCIFPSKDQRDWSKFEEAKPKFDITTLKPFDKVLVRDNNEQFWTCDWFSFHDTKQVYPFACVGHYVSQCIPYEENQHLLGTTNDCEEYYKNW